MTKSPIITKAGTSTPTHKEQKKSNTSLGSPWNVIIYDDPVNLMEYVTYVIKKLFGYPKNRAHHLIMTVHTSGKAVVWTGDKEKAEVYVAQLHMHQLHAGLEKSS